MKVILKIFLILVLYNSFAFAKSEKNKPIKSPNLTSKDLKKMSFNRLYIMRKAYRDFIAKMENEFQTYPKFTPQKYSSIQEFKKYFDKIERFYSAYANDGDMCIFGGWMSKAKDGFCEPPWKHKDDETIVSEYKDTYSKDQYCKGTKSFRCNPILFGEGEDSGKGHCVEITTYKGLSKKCEDKGHESGAIPALIDKIKNDDKTREQFLKYQDFIFGKDGESGFCSPDKTVESHGDVYDACDHLKRKIEALADKESDGEITADDTQKEAVIPSSPGISPHHEKSLQVLNQCANHLVDNSSDDINDRKILEHLSGGVAYCNGGAVPDTAANISFKDMEKVAKSYDKRKMLRKLNVKSFEYQLTALLNNEISFLQNRDASSFTPEKKAELFAKIAEKFPKLKTEKEFEDSFNKIFDRYKNATKKDQIGKVDYKNAIANLQHFANIGDYGDTTDSVNEFCSSINSEFKEKFDDKKRMWGLEWTRRYSKEEKEYIAQRKQEMNHKINATFENSQVGFLLGTDHFMENVFDPTVDIVKNCISDANYPVIKPNISESDYNKALAQAQEKVWDSFGDLKKKDYPVTASYEINNSYAGAYGSYGLYTDGEIEADKEITKYLKENKMIVVDELMYADANEQVDMSKYLCTKITDIYDQDEINQVFSLIGTGVSIIGGITCAIPPFAPVGCPVMYGGVTLAGISGVNNMINGSNLENSAMLNQIVQNHSATAFSDQAKKGNDQFEQGAWEFGGAIATPVLAGAGKGVSVIRNAAKGKSIPVIDGKAVLVQEGGDNVLRLMQSSLPGKGSVPSVSLPSGTGNFVALPSGATNTAKALVSGADEVLALPPRSVNFELVKTAAQADDVVIEAVEIGRVVRYVDKKTGRILYRNIKGEEEIGSAFRYFEPDAGKNGKWLLRTVKDEARSIGAMDDATRARSFMAEFPGSSEKQVKAVLNIHNGVADDGTKVIVTTAKGEKVGLDCFIGECIKAQLKAKLEMLKDAGFTSEQSKKIIRLGYAGKTNPKLPEIAADGFWSVRHADDGFSTLYNNPIAKGHPARAGIDALESTAKFGDEPLVRVTVDRVTKSGDIKTEIVIGKFIGSTKDKGKLLIEGSGKSAVIDPNDANLVIKAVETPQPARYVAGKLVKEDWATVMDANPVSLLSKNVGKNVKVTTNNAGDVFEYTGEIVNHNGKVQLKVPDSTTPGKFTYDAIDEIDQIGKIEFNFSSGSWKGSTHLRLLDDAIEEGANITLKNQFNNKTGTFIGRTTDKSGDLIIIRSPAGKVEYIPVTDDMIITSKGGSVTEFSSDLIP